MQIQKSDLRLQMAKIRADHRTEVRNQLTDEQKVKFDQKSYNFV